jgi:Domain of unknown function (DUF5658)
VEQLAPNAYGNGEHFRLRIEAFALAVALLALNILDLVVTHANITLLGAIEANPLMAPLIGTPAAVVAKVGIPIVIMGLTLRISSRRVVRLLRFGVALYLAISIVTLGQFAIAIV